MNCGAIPEHLIASELFGFEKGSFTGANEKGNIGKIQAADGGTLFLDEIGEMSLDLQVFLLRFLDQKQITPIESHILQSVDVRILTATNRDFVQEIERGNFRNDLYYRLCELEITMLSLRERTDLLFLANYFLKKMIEELNAPELSIDKHVQKTMQEYNWPGNIRELQHVIRQAAYYAFFLGPPQRSP